MIEFYSFGQITINGRRYNRDIIIFPDHIKDSWWRKEGHKLNLEDLKEIFKAKPAVLVIGSGYFGLMKVPQEVKNHITSKNIELIVENTKQACQTYNSLCQTRKVVGAFHLTC